MHFIQRQQDRPIYGRTRTEVAREDSDRNLGLGCLLHRGRSFVDGRLVVGRSYRFVMSKSGRRLAGKRPFIPKDSYPTRAYF